MVSTATSSAAATVRLRLHRPGACAVLVTWSRNGVAVGSRRVYDAQVDLVLPGAGTWTLDVTDTRAVHDPSRFGPGRVVVRTRAGWRTDAEVSLTRGVTVSGSVRTVPDGRARWAHVVATTADGRVLRTRADGLGRFTLAGLPPETLVLVTAHDRTHQSVPVLLPEPDAGRQPRLVLTLADPFLGTSRPGAPEPVVGAAFRGTVVDPDTGVAAYAARVEVRDPRGALLARTRTDGQGRFVVGGDLPASAGLSVTVSSGPGDVVIDRLRLRGLSCGAGQLVDLGTLALRRAARQPRPARASLPRSNAHALTLPATRV